MITAWGGLLGPAQPGWGEPSMRCSALHSASLYWLLKDTRWPPAPRAARFSTPCAAADPAMRSRATTVATYQHDPDVLMMPPRYCSTAPEVSPYCLTAPKVSPVTMWRWTTTASRSTGSVMSVAAAARVPHLISSYQIMLKTAMGRVRVCRPARITEKRKLFHEKTKARIPVATTPGLTSGSATRQK